MEYAKQLEAIRKARIKARELQIYTQEFAIIPYMTTGYIDLTNEGFLTYQANPENFNTFRRLYTGKESVNVIWKDSVYIKQEADIYGIKFKLGEVLLGLIETTDHSNQITNDNNFSDYISQQINKTYKFRVYPTFKLTDYYQYLLYKIPELSGSTVFRVVSIEEDFIGNEIAAYVMELQSINQAFAQTGSAVQQTINNSTPGAGYLEAIVKGAEWKQEMIDKGLWDTLVPGVDYYEFFDKYITADFTKIKNNPIKRACVKIYGASVPMAITFIGRKADFDSHQIHPSGLIFGMNWTNNSPTPDLYKAGSILDNFYMGAFHTEVVFEKGIFEALTAALNFAEEWDYQGFLTYNKKQLIGSNGDPVSNQWLPKQALNDWWIGVGNLGLRPFQFINVLGVATGFIPFVKKNEVPLHDFFFLNYFRNKEWGHLPYTVKQIARSKGFFGTVIQGLTGIIGTTATLITNIFTGRMWQPGSTYSSDSNQFFGIIPADLVELNDKYFQGDKIPFNVFDTNKDGSNPSSILLNSASQQITLYGDLTQTFIKNGVRYTTPLIGQRQHPNGSWILPTKEPLLMEGDEELEADNNGFIIEGFQLEAIANCDFSIEFFNANGEMVYQGFFQTNAKWTGNHRNFRTEKNLNAFANVEQQIIAPPTWPEVPKPTPPKPLIEFETKRRFGNSNITVKHDIVPPNNAAVAPGVLFRHKRLGQLAWSNFNPISISGNTNQTAKAEIALFDTIKKVQDLIGYEKLVISNIRAELERNKFKTILKDISLNVSEFINKLGGAPVKFSFPNRLSNPPGDKIISRVFGTEQKWQPSANTALWMTNGANDPAVKTLNIAHENAYIVNELTNGNDKFINLYVQLEPGVGLRVSLELAVSTQNNSGAIQLNDFHNIQMKTNFNGEGYCSFFINESDFKGATHYNSADFGKLAIRTKNSLIPKKM